MYKAESVFLFIVPRNQPFSADLDQIWCESSFRPEDCHGHGVFISN